jgi:succinate dehydrogenase / fumarate reductase, cytochrome b subunit
MIATLPRPPAQGPYSGPLMPVASPKLSSSIGRKLLVALTGVMLLGFLIAHLAGNLQVFLGQEAINAYAAGLRELGPLLWVARIGLIFVAVVHVVLTVQIAAENRVARPVRYRATGRIQTTLQSRSMTLTGLMLLAFVVFHLAHLTWGLTHPEQHALKDALGRPDVYSMMVLGFRQPAVAGTYLVAMVLLGLHLMHGLSSVWQTLGVDSPRWNGLLLATGPVLGTLITAGYLAIPAAVYAGFIALPPGVQG